MVPKNGNRFLEKIMVETENSYDFRPVTEKDLPMIARWLAEPHVAAWWDDPAKEIAESLRREAEYEAQQAALAEHLSEEPQKSDAKAG